MCAIRALTSLFCIVWVTPFLISRLNISSGRPPLWYRSTVALLVIPRLCVSILLRASCLKCPVLGPACGLVLHMLLMVPVTRMILVFILSVCRVVAALAEKQGVFRLVLKTIMWFPLRR